MEKGFLMAALSRRVPFALLASLAVSILSSAPVAPAHAVIELCAKFGGDCGSRRAADIQTETVTSVSPLRAFTAEPERLEGGLTADGAGNFVGTSSSGGALGRGTIYRVTPSGQLTTLHAFEGAPDGSSPLSTLMRASDGNYYGTARGGDGLVFRLTPSGDYTVLHRFSGDDGRLTDPFADFDLLEASDGLLYGCTRTGGTADEGTVYRISPAGEFASLFSFDDSASSGAFPRCGLVEGEDGALYGVAESGGTSGNGVVFRISREGDFDVVYNFTDADGEFPVGHLLPVGSAAFLGVTRRGGTDGVGTIYRVTEAGDFSQLHSFDIFGAAGTWPQTGLTLGPDGAAYGSALSGGSNRGTVFRVSPAGAVTVVHEFTGAGAGPSFRSSRLVDGGDGFLYGTTRRGEARGNGGTVFRVSPDGNFRRLRTFGNPNGSRPIGGVARRASDRAIFGTTFDGGDLTADVPRVGRGTVFRLSSDGAIELLHSFDTFDSGGEPIGVAQASDGALYGATLAGVGAVDAGDAEIGCNRGCGSLFRVGVDGAFQTLHEFAGSDGRLPSSPPVEGSDGALYGTASSGGNSDAGVVYRITPDGSLMVLHAFSGGDGRRPIGRLVTGADGALYGTTQEGGAVDQGTVFRITQSGSFTLLHSFNGTDGAEPIAALLPLDDGTFLGSTSVGGSDDQGALFRITAAGDLTKLHDFAGDDGSGPEGALIRGSDGNFYGTTVGGGEFGLGTAFRYSEDGVLTTLFSLGGGDGAFPQGALLELEGGVFIGTASGLGPEEGGAVFRFEVTEMPADGTVSDGGGGGGGAGWSFLMALGVAGALRVVRQNLPVKFDC